MAKTDRRRTQADKGNIEMTTEIEKQFFECFGIGKVKRRCCSLDSETHCPTDYITCEDCSHWIKTEDELDKYPEITDRKLLELICILDNFTIQNYLKKQPFDIFELKQNVLRRCLYLDNIGINKDELRQQIRKLFEDKEQ